MMKIIKILLVLTVLFISISAVSAEGNFTALQNEINSSGDSIDIKNDYVYDNATDYSYNEGISVNKSNFTINGNGHTINGANQARIFEIDGENITILNLNFINAKSNSMGGAISAAGSVTLNNVTFINNFAESGGAISALSSLTIDNGRFANNRAKHGGAIFAMEQTKISNSVLSANTADTGGAINNGMNLTTDNVTFKNNNATSQGGAIFSVGNYASMNDKFINNYCNNGVLSQSDGRLELINGSFISKNELYQGLIYAYNASIFLENTTFSNMASRYATALYMSKSGGKIRNCNFVNLTASASGGALGIINIRDNITLENCSFINTTSKRNGGAIFIDASKSVKSARLESIANIINSTFIDCSSEFGGAILQLNGRLKIDKSRFITGNASVSGGAIYTSFTDLNLKNSELTGNCAFKNGGAIYVELTNATIDNATLTGNKVENTSSTNPDTIYAYDTGLYIRNSFFNNSKYSIFSLFTADYLDENNTLNDDEFSLNNTYYMTEVRNNAVKLELINNSIDVTDIPSRFDLREWGWVTPVKDQESKGYCWVFGTYSALESALLKATGVEYDFSENNAGNNGIIYASYGSTEEGEGGMVRNALGYLLSWHGPVPEEIDPYYGMTKVSDSYYSENRIHIQDVLFIPIKKSADYVVSNETNTMIKEALLKYGVVTMTYAGDEKYYDAKTKAVYHNETYLCDHTVSFIGWDDNYSKDNFNITPPGDGAWIFKNSWGSEWGNNGYAYISYYDTSLLAPDDSEYSEIDYITAFIIENTENYKYNYQTDLTGIRQFNENYSHYANTYVAAANNLLGAVGTYFNNSDIDYEFKVYVNDELKLIQNGTSEFAGYRTIKLNEYIPVKENDIFKVVFKNNAIPYQDKSREHYMRNTSFVSDDGENWIDCSSLNMTACLKVYAFDLAIYTEDLVKIYKNDSKFEAGIGIAKEKVTFEINGMNYTRLSDENGTARMAINLKPGSYTIKTTFNGTTVENTITVLPTLIADNLVKYFRNASQFFISLIEGAENPVSGVNITMNINGVLYNRSTNENGTAKLNINLEPGEYILTATDPLTGLQMSYNITVLPVLFGDNLEMKYKDGSTFNALVLNGEGKPMTNAKVTFNVNGVFYTRYTNSSGMAKLNINLMAGEYIITSEFDEMKISNTITIRD